MNNKSTEEITRVFFARHGLTEQTGKILYGQTKGIELSEEGHGQAKLLAQYFSDIDLHHIFSSPLERAYQTALAVADSKKMTVDIKEELIESHAGTWTNLSLEECAQQEEWKIVQETPSQFCFPGGESFNDVLARMQRTVDDLVDSHQGRNILITSHSGPITSLLAHYLGVPLDHYERIPCAPASVSEVHFFNGIVRVESINVVPNIRMV